MQTGSRSAGRAEDGMKNKNVELISDKAERVIFLLLAIFLAVFLYLE